MRGINTLTKKYTVVTADNFHYIEEDETEVARQFSSAEEAIAAAKAILDKVLLHSLNISAFAMTAAELFNSYIDFVGGDSPFIRAPVGEPKVGFAT